MFPGISTFWTDDYKVFEQIYGKTSDKDIFGATLPPAIGYGIDTSKLRNQASEKKERYLENFEQNTAEDYSVDPSSYEYGVRRPNILSKYTNKVPQSTYKFINTDFKPISLNNEPDVYRYLQHLEQLEKDKVEFPDLTAGGFKPYLKYAGNSEENDAYKSIQDILDAHEANKAKVKDETDDQVKYLTYGNSKDKGRARSKKTTYRAPVSKNKARCPSGRCRKRTTSTYRVRTRPYLRRIKHKIYY